MHEFQQFTAMRNFSKLTENENCWMALLLKLVRYLKIQVEMQVENKILRANIQLNKNVKVKNIQAMVNTLSYFCIKYSDGKKFE